MKITICGSMAFARDMSDIGSILEADGHEVTSPAEMHRHLDPNNTIDNKAEKIELDVIKKYYLEISRTDAVLVINNSKKGIENYIGGNSLIEMAFAYALDKKIYLLNPVPKMSYTDEIEAMHPVVLGGDISRIKKF